MEGGRREKRKTKKSQKMIRGLTVLDTRAGWDEKCSRRETVGQKQMRPWTRPELQPADKGENKEEHGWCRKRNNNKTTLKKKKNPTEKRKFQAWRK